MASFSLSAPPPFETVAAVDLGSNSFHMVVARLEQGRLHVLDTLRERVRLASGMDADGNLSDKATARAIACLERFGERVRHMPGGSVRAVGTQALRKARDRRTFLDRAREALGHDIEVIYGQEEARLIYLAVTHDLAAGDGRRLVVDIGGGSTECMLGGGFEVLAAESLPVGCVSFSERFFPEGRVRSNAFKRARTAALLELTAINAHYRAVGWTQSVGASGTILAAEKVVTQNGWSEDGVTAKSLKKLQRTLEKGGDVYAVDLAGLSKERRPVFAGGVAILAAVFEAFGVERMVTSDGALREGVLYDLVGRLEHHDVRDHTIRSFEQRYALDVEQSARVERTALSLLDQTAHSWDLGGEFPGKLLSWAARLLEAGLAVARGGYHRHSAYLVAHADMPGFSHDDQRTLATLIRTHRRKMPGLLFDEVPRSRRELTTRLAAILRLAARLNRSRTAGALPDIVAEADGADLTLTFPEGWLEEHPLTQADLEEEATLLKSVKIKLSAR